MTSKSLWMDTEVAPQAEVLDGVHECDVAVIGSGIAGISTAYELSKRGKSVIVIDRGRICGGMTSRTSAHLAPLCDDLVSEMIKIKGKEATKLFCESQAAAVDRIEEIQKKEKIDCDFRRLDGYLFQGRDMPADVIGQEMDAVREVGAPVDRLVGRALKRVRRPSCTALSPAGDLPSPQIPCRGGGGLQQKWRGVLPGQPGRGSD
jgi:glycine/D-amino acid oxidase-like deaminating enzyme